MSDQQQVIMDALSEITDPEIPVVTIKEMGMLRGVQQDDLGVWVITVTPTYSGCPATDMIAALIRWKMAELGIDDFRLETRITPAWTTDWMSEEARTKLESYGIAPPNPDHRCNHPVRCPQCASDDVEEVSRFGSTACKALWKCRTCLEPFDYFKCH